MVAVRDKSWFPRRGLFAKYVVALVGLVVFVLAVNGATETWISYRATKTTLTDAMAEKAEADRPADRSGGVRTGAPDQRATRASADTADKRRAAYAAAAQPGPGGEPALPAQRPGPRAAAAVAHQRGGEQRRGSVRRCALHRNRRRAGSITRRPRSRARSPTMSIAVAHSGFNAGVTIADIDLAFLQDFVSDAQVGRTNFAYVVDPRGEVLASSAQGPEVGKDLSKLPQVAALMTPEGKAVQHRASTPTAMPCSTAAGVVPKLGWIVLFEQPTALALAPIRDQLVRGAPADRARAAGRDPRRHHFGAADADPDHGAEHRRATARRRRFRPSHRGQDRRRAGRARRAVQRHGRPARRRPMPASNPRSRSGRGISPARSTN